MSLRNYYRTIMSERDHRYFETYSPRDQHLVIEEAKDRLQEQNLVSLKECVRATPITKLLGIVSHVSRLGSTAFLLLGLRILLSDFTLGPS
jgi:hypothetical protein